jgi:hypothetical protein
MATGKPTKVFVSAVKDACKRDLSAAGFQRQRIGYALGLTPGFVGRLGLNVAVDREDGCVEVNPIVGVRAQEVEQLVTQLSGRNAHNPFLPTISTNLGYVMPQASYYRRLFCSYDDLDAGAAELTQLVVSFGLPFMRRNSNLEDLSQSMEGHVGWPDVISYSLPVAYVLLGQLDRAHAYVRRRLTKLDETPSPATDQYRRFADRIIADDLVRSPQHDDEHS